MTNKQIEAELRLFKAFTVYDEHNSLKNNTVSSVEKGILYTRDVHDNIKELAEKLYGIKPEQWNQTFHKSFGTVLDTPIEKLVAQQIIHYFTTYGLESLGIYDQDLVYIPREKLEIPEIEQDIELKVIRNISEEELGKRLMTLLTSGIALSKQTIKDIMELSDYIDSDKLDDIKNREIKLALYDKYGLVPSDATEFLKYVTYKITGQTLFIKSVDMLKLVKKADKEKAYQYFNKYIKTKNGYTKLSEIFLANRQMFLAYKTKNAQTEESKNLNHIINRLDKLRKKNHKPFKKGILDSLGEIKTLKEIEQKKEAILNALNNTTIFREVRIINGLKYRTIASVSNTKSIAYRIRNGKVYATEVDKLTDRQLRVKEVLLHLIENHFIKRVTPLIKGKTFYIPENVSYTVPTSEKQFIGELPDGSFVEIPRENGMVIGVHWYNLERERVDLDLKMMNLTSSYGWDACYLSEDGSGDIVFSGDLTDAPKPDGACEVFLISPKYNNKSFLIKLNNFTRNNQTVPFEFFVAKDEQSITHKNYTVNPNKIVMLTNNKFDNDGNTDNTRVSATLTLGYVEVTDTKIKIYFKSFEDVHSRTSRIDSVNKNIFKHTQLNNMTQMKLNDIIKSCGGILLDNPETEKLEEVITSDGETLYRKVKIKPDYDLSLNTLSKDSIIKIFTEV